MREHLRRADRPFVPGHPDIQNKEKQMPQYVPEGILFPTGGAPVDPGFGHPGGGHHPSHPIAGGGGHPSHPIALPPLPGIWPPPGQISLPIYLPPEIPGVPSPPIYIDASPEHPITLPPNTIWPPLPPDSGGGTEKRAVLVWVSGVGHRWFIYEPGATPPVATPK
jgi:hypothetical protein